MTRTEFESSPIPVYSSKHNWPDARGSDMSWTAGDHAILHSKTGKNPSIEVVLTRTGFVNHPADYETLCVEVRFPIEHGGNVCRVDADQLQPLFGERK